MTAENFEERRRALRASLAAALERARHLLFALRPPHLELGGLRSGLETLCQETAAAAGWELSLDLTDRRYPEPIETLVYRVAREAILNAHRHANGCALEVKLYEEAAELHCVVRDDGVGFNLEAVRTRPRARLHLGLDLLLERVRLAGGNAQIMTESGRGTTISFTVPVGDNSPLATA